MQRGTAIVAAAIGGFFVAFLAVQIYLWPEWHRDDCEGLECLGALIFSIYAGVFAGVCITIIVGFAASWLVPRRKAGDAPFDTDA